MPDYLREALGKMSADVPEGWAYTLTTERNHEVSTTERFDPSRPPGAQWTLLRYNGRPPAERELEKYTRYRAANPAVVSQATFQKADVDPGSITLVREDADRAEFTAGFRRESAGADKMLAHLRLGLVVHKRPACLERFTLDLREPYSPVLSVRMHELHVAMIFTAPDGDRPGLPAVSTSHFVGRIFFFGTEENLHVTYSDYVRSK
ncbi:MAG: hypothetical protein JWQ62_2258 [Lacunisphaera sp.]|nr:hypothetical protein [Lacunisphaera sp.]